MTALEIVLAIYGFLVTALAIWFNCEWGAALNRNLTTLDAWDSSEREFVAAFLSKNEAYVTPFPPCWRQSQIT
jgi:hypothetical protein